MGTTFTYPGPDFPAPPSVSLHAPDEWAAARGLEPAGRQLQDPGLLLLAVRRTTHDGGFPATVVVTAEDVPATPGPAEADQGLAQQAPADQDLTERVLAQQALAELARAGDEQGGDVSTMFTVPLAGRGFVGCDIAWPDETHGRIVQAHLVTALAPVGADDTAWLVRVTGTVGGAGADDEYALMQQVMATIRVTPRSGSREARATGQ